MGEVDEEDVLAISGLHDPALGRALVLGELVHDLAPGELERLAGFLGGSDIVARLAVDLAEHAPGVSKSTHDPVLAWR